MGKYNKYTFHDKYSQAEAILEIVHSDVCGLFSTTSTAKDKYYVIFVDDFIESDGFYSCIRKIIHSLNFLNLKDLLREALVGNLKLLGLIMVENVK